LSPLEILGTGFFILILLLGIFSILFGIPGTVIILIDAALYAALTGFDRIGWKTLATLLVLSILAELSDFAIGMAGAVKFGASKQSLIASVAGSIVGAAMLAPFLLGIGAVMGAFIGGFAAVFIVEILKQFNVKPALRAAWGTFIGRAAGICVKGAFALAMTAITLSGVYG
jgi:uncharacterized protein YqgC (DUF456 family)